MCREQGWFDKKESRITVYCVRSLMTAERMRENNVFELYLFLQRNFFSINLSVRRVVWSTSHFCNKSPKGIQTIAKKIVILIHNELAQNGNYTY